MNDVAKNKELVRTWITAVNERKLDSALGLVTEDFVNHAAVPEAQGREGMRSILGKLLKAMPDMKWTCEDLLAEGDRVMCRVTVSGTQTGPFEFTRSGFPATGRELSTEQLHVFRIANGLAVEHWAGRDDFGMMRQLGVGPFAAGAKA